MGLKQTSDNWNDSQKFMVDGSECTVAVVTAKNYCTVLRKKAEFRLATKGQHRFLGRLGAGNIFLGGAYGKQIPD